jgi:hypothetical protein
MVDRVWRDRDWSSAPVSDPYFQPEPHSPAAQIWGDSVWVGWVSPIGAMPSRGPVDPNLKSEISAFHLRYRFTYSAFVDAEEVGGAPHLEMAEPTKTSKLIQNESANRKPR